MIHLQMHSGPFTLVDTHTTATLSSCSSTPFRRSQHRKDRYGNPSNKKTQRRRCTV